jgi:uncharacterized protein (TIGR00251 family)
VTQSWYAYDPARQTLLLHVHVQPGARVSGVAGLHGEALRVRIAAPAVDDKANAALVAFLAERLGVPKRALEIRRGQHGRQKTIAVAGASGAVVTRLAALAVND